MKNYENLLRNIAISILFLSLSSLCKAGTITLFAAASLTDALTEISHLYTKLHPDIDIRTSFSASSTLAKQIANGAAADIFISADTDWMNYLQNNAHIIPENRKILLSNKLVIIRNSSENIGIKLTDSANQVSSRFSGRWCTGDPTHVPVGKYAQQALSYYNWWEVLKPRLAATENVRSALDFVARGECKIGIVYETDALLNKNVVVQAIFPEKSHSPIIYPSALLNSKNSEAASYWVFLQSLQARAVFKRYGFTPLP
jgi:molybdate transport system substrate-binding protein